MAINEGYRALIHSEKVSAQTRAVLMGRGASDSLSYNAEALTDAELMTLRRVAARVIPQTSASGEPIDIGARLDRMMAEGKGDGWRYATLPEDAEACRTGLHLLNEFAGKLKGVSFVDLAPEAQDGLLDAIASGRMQSPKLDLKRWFEDLRANMTQIYVAHPETLARMGYSGIADDPNGFVQLGIGQVEAWEPEAQ